MSSTILSNLPSTAFLDMLGLQSKPSGANRAVTYVGLVVAGAVVGAAAALMLTPKSGRELRQDMRGSAKELGDHVSHTAGAVVEAAREKGRDIRNHIGEPMPTI